VRRWINGYDTGIRYADDHIAHLIETLDRAGVLDDTAIIVSADHGESQGELNVWGDHQTADSIVSRIPLIVRWPGASARVDTGLHYQFDWAATLLELLGIECPDNWDARAFAESFRAGREEGRTYLVLAQAAWTCMRSVRWSEYLCMRTYHDGYQDLAPLKLFNVSTDPHLERDLVGDRQDLIDHAMRLLTDWQFSAMLTSPTAEDPMVTVLREGGPWQVHGYLPRYLRRLRLTGREEAARRLETRYLKRR
jgi:arylsulfatase A-like enzyme